MTFIETLGYPRGTDGFLGWRYLAYNCFYSQETIHRENAVFANRSRVKGFKRRVNLNPLNIWFGKFDYRM
jgi:hypothetical protein